MEEPAPVFLRMRSRSGEVRYASELPCVRLLLAVASGSRYISPRTFVDIADSPPCMSRRLSDLRWSCGCALVASTMRLCAPVRRSACCWPPAASDRAPRSQAPACCRRRHADAATSWPAVDCVGRRCRIRRLSMSRPRRRELVRRRASTSPRRRPCAHAAGRMVSRPPTGSASIPGRRVELGINGSEGNNNVFSMRTGGHVKRDDPALEARLQPRLQQEPRQRRRDAEQRQARLCGSTASSPSRRGRCSCWRT